MPREERREGESRAKRPVFDCRAGMVKVAVWENEGSNGTFPTATFARGRVRSSGVRDGSRHPGC